MDNFINWISYSPRRFLAVLFTAIILGLLLFLSLGCAHTQKPVPKEPEIQLVECMSKTVTWMMVEVENVLYETTLDAGCRCIYEYQDTLLISVDPVINPACVTQPEEGRNGVHHEPEDESAL